MQTLPTVPTAPALPEVSGLSLDIRRLVAASIAPNTAKAYTAALAAFEAWLNGQAPSDPLLAEYLAERHAAGVSPAAVNQVVQAVRFREKAPCRRRVHCWPDRKPHPGRDTPRRSGPRPRPGRRDPLGGRERDLPTSCNHHGWGRTPGRYP